MNKYTNLTDNVTNIDKVFKDFNISQLDDINTEENTPTVSGLRVERRADLHQIVDVRISCKYLGIGID